MKKSLKMISVVLFQDVPNFGKAGQQVKVKAGFARNFLIPKNLAVLTGNPHAQKIILKQAELKQKTHLKKEEAEKTIQNLEGKKIIFAVKVNQKGQPYKAIQPKEIAQKLNLPEEYIKSAPLKTLGENQVLINSHNLKTKIKVVLEAQK